MLVGVVVAPSGKFGDGDAVTSGFEGFSAAGLVGAGMDVAASGVADAGLVDWERGAGGDEGMGTPAAAAVVVSDGGPDAFAVEPPIQELSDHEMYLCCCRTRRGASRAGTTPR